MNDTYYVNGNFLRSENAMISVEDRGFLFGDGVYEVIRAYNSKIFRFKDHIERLKISLQDICIEYEKIEDLAHICNEALFRSGYSDALIYIQITRGMAKRSHVPPKGIKPTTVVIVYATPSLPPQLFEKGAKAILYPDKRWANCYIKSLQLLPNTLALTKAYSEESNEAILHKDGYVTECGSSNLFIVKNNTIQTHPADNSILHGISRKVVFEIAEKMNVNILEKKFTISELLNADEVFITNTLVEVLPITKIDDAFISSKVPGPISKQLMGAFKKLIEI